VDGTDLNSLVAPFALADLSTRPGFDDAAESLARGSLRAFAQADDAGRWMFRDIGRGSLYLATVVLNAAGGVTASSLASEARTHRIASRGRVMAFLRRAEACGELTVPPGTGGWTQRRLILGPRFIDRFRRCNLVCAEAVAPLAPEVASLVARLGEDAFFNKFVLGVATAGPVAIALDQASGYRERLFLDRDCGIGMLFRLMCGQPRPRARLLEQAQLSRAALAREFGVSRAHINRLLADAAAQELLYCPTSDRVVFSPALSADVERMIVRTLQVTRTALLIAAQGRQVSL
jgi:hypothetical protein